MEPEEVAGLVEGRQDRPGHLQPSVRLASTRTPASPAGLESCSMGERPPRPETRLSSTRVPRTSPWRLMPESVASTIVFPAIRLLRASLARMPLNAPLMKLSLARFRRAPSAR
jgi:hypothetical protein